MEEAKKEILDNLLQGQKGQDVIRRSEEQPGPGKIQMGEVKKELPDTGIADPDG